MRELKFHEQKLLKKVNFLQWKSDQNVREIQVLRRYHVQNRDDYVKYSKVAGLITKLAAKLKLLKQDDPVRIKTTDLLIDKMFAMGLIPTKKSLLQCEALPVERILKRPLAPFSSP
jgi:U3 small nucleolar ribonucleoprotein protein IMP3